MTKKTTKRILKARPYNNGTMTASMFFSMIRSALRAKSRWWKPIDECKKRAKRQYKGPNKRQKFEYQCNECKEYFPDKQVNVDHIIPAGELTSLNHLPKFVERLFCEVDGLQLLCIQCHDIKSNNERINRKKK